MPDDLAAEVGSAVQRGEYAPESEAVLEAVAEWRAQGVAEMIGVEELRRLWREGVDSTPGLSMSVDEIKAESRRRFSPARQDAYRSNCVRRRGPDRHWTYIASDGESGSGARRT